MTRGQQYRVRRDGGRDRLGATSTTANHLTNPDDARSKAAVGWEAEYRQSAPLISAPARCDAAQWVPNDECTTVHVVIELGG